MEHFILTEKEQQVFKLCSALLNKDHGVMSFEEISQEINLSKTTINYAIEKLRDILTQVLGEGQYSLVKTSDTLYLEFAHSVSFQMLKNAYISDSFFLYFFQEVYHERFSCLMSVTDVKFISYETGKKKLVSCKQYLKHFSLVLCMKKKVTDLICGEEKQVRFMFFCMILSKFQSKCHVFFESENPKLTLFLDNMMKTFPYILPSSYLKLKIFYRIALDRIEKGHLLPDDMVFPDYCDYPGLSLAVFSEKVAPLFANIALTAQQKKIEVEFFYFLFSTLIFQPSDILEQLEYQSQTCKTFEIFYQTVKQVSGMTFTVPEKRFMSYAHQQCMIWHQMFHVSFSFQHLFTEQKRFMDRNSRYMLLWHRITAALQDYPVYQELFLEHPNMPFFLQRIFNAISFSKEIPCKVFLLCYSPITQSIAMANLKNRNLTIQVDFVNSLKEADIVISELALENRENVNPFICFVDTPFNKRDWKNIENLIIRWRESL